MYKKRLTESVGIKKLQVEEIELNIAYFEAKKAWKELQPEIEKLEALEQAEIQKQQEEMKEAEKSKIQPVKQGKPRKKVEITK